MSRLRLRQVWLALLVMALFAPVALAVGTPVFRPAWLSAPLVGAVPASAVVVTGYILVLVVLVYVLSGSAFGDRAPQEEDRP
jgi:uncharacterized membrane protein (DUF485 family)